MTHLLLRRRGDLGARQRDVGQAPLLHAAAVVGDLERTALVVVQAASCRGTQAGLETASSFRRSLNTSRATK